MSRMPTNQRSNSQYASADFGAPLEWSEYVRHHPKLGAVAGKVFLKDVVGLTGMEVSLGLMQPGESNPLLHAHKQNEELYLFVSGKGEMQVDGEVVPVTAGSAVRISPKAWRSWRNTGTEPLTYLVVQAKAGSLEQATATDGLLNEKGPSW